MKIGRYVYKMDLQVKLKFHGVWFIFLWKNKEFCNFAFYEGYVSFEYVEAGRGHVLLQQNS